jgi:hypothetical protein
MSQYNVNYYIKYIKLDYDNKIFYLYLRCI